MNVIADDSIVFSFRLVLVTYKYIAIRYNYILYVNRYMLRKIECNI